MIAWIFTVNLSNYYHDVEEVDNLAVDDIVLCKKIFRMCHSFELQVVALRDFVKNLLMLAQMVIHLNTGEMIPDKLTGWILKKHSILLPGHTFKS